MSAVPETLNLSLVAGQYVKLGWALVPIDSGTKKPSGAGWNQRERCITTIAGCRRIRANVGLAHAYSRTCVLDLDDFELATAWLAENGIAMADLWDALDAVKINSGRPNKGKLLYRLPAGVEPLVSIHLHEEGIELRCATIGGKTDQDLLPPSIHPDTGRPYEWVFDDMLGHWSNPPELPAAVLALWRSLAPRRVDSSTTSGEGDIEAAKAVLAKFSPDIGYHPWIHVGMALHHEFAGGYEGLELWDLWSAPGAEYKGMEDLEKHWVTFDNHKSGGLHTLETLRAKLRQKPSTPDEFDSWLEEEPPTPAEDAPADNQPAAVEAPPEENSMFDDLGPDPDVVGRDLSALPAPAKKKGFAFYTAAEFLTLPAPSWIIKGLLPRAELGVIYGGSGSGKTFVALDQAMAIARGVDWRGHRTTQGRVAYIAAEDPGGLTDRVRAYCHEHQVDMATLPLHFLPAAPDFMDNEKESTAGVLALARELKKLGPLAAIYVDTYARVMSGDENVAKDAGAVIANCAHLHRAAKGALVVLVHHSGKDGAKGARGSGALRAAADVEYEVTKSTARHTMTVTKMKNGRDGGQLHYKLLQVTVGVDEYGEDRTSCVVEHMADSVAADPVPPEANKKLSPVRARLLEQMAEYVGGEVSMEDFILDVRAITPLPASGVESHNWRALITKPLRKLIDEGAIVEIQGILSLPKTACD